MVCPYCQHDDTHVTNSRQHRSMPRIWRRRHCSRCKTTFTTYEEIAPKELPLIRDDTDHQQFSLPRLLVSIHACLAGAQAADQADALARTVAARIGEAGSQSLSRADIASQTYQTLSLYDKRAGLRYGVLHGLVTPDDMMR